MSNLIKDEEYRVWIVSIKSRIQASQIKAAVAVNYAMLELYWYLGEQIIERQETAKWGDGFLEQMSRDLLAEFPEMKGFSYRNLRSIRQWVSFWNRPDSIGKQAVSKSDSNWKQVVAKLAPNAKQLVSQIPWGHNVLLVQKLNDPTDALFYVQKNDRKQLVASRPDTPDRIRPAPARGPGDRQFRRNLAKTRKRPCPPTAA